MYSQHNQKKINLHYLIWLTIPIALVAFGLLTRHQSNEVVKKWTERQATPVVRLVGNLGQQNESQIIIPGRLEPYNKASIYARVNGYLKYWNKDIGALVHKGELLAEIDTPELDHQLDQAKADLVSAIQSQKLADVTRKRWENLLVTDSVSKQAADEKVSDFASKTANVQALQANVRRLESTIAFRKVVAPFNGKIIERNTDIGSLINAASNGGEANLPLFSVADIHKLRVYVDVPESYAGKLNQIQSASITIPEMPGKQFKIKLIGSSGAIDSKSGSTLTQFEVANENNLLSPGGYAQVTINLPKDNNIRQLPISAIMVRNKGVQVATVSQNNRVVIKSITVGNDFGSTIEVLSGLNSDDKVIDGPPDLIENGELITIKQSIGSPDPKAKASL